MWLQLLALCNGRQVSQSDKKVKEFTCHKMTWGCLIFEAAPSHYFTLLYIPAVFAKIPEIVPYSRTFFGIISGLGLGLILFGICSA